jgi:hypothetical protein
VKGQLTLTVNEAKRLIAKAVAALPEVRFALERGRVLLKGGTAARQVEGPHSALISAGRAVNIDAEIVEVARSLGPDDVVIIGGNALDPQGNVAMMAGSASGGLPGEAMSGFVAEGAAVIIPIGLEKLIPCPIAQAVRAAGRKGVDLALGMGVGLIPIQGRVVTERDAAGILAAVRATVIGRGGIMGAEGATVMAVEGERADVEKLFALVRTIKGASLSGIPESLEECQGASPRCRDHLACVYRKEKSS